MSTTHVGRPSEPSVIRETSSPSASVFWLDIREVKRRLRRAARRLGKAHPEIEAVWLFGSLARAEAVPGSDADILVVLDASALPFAQRPVHYRLEWCGIGVDMLIYTRAEIERMYREGNPFLRRIEEERCLLWQRQSRPAHSVAR